MYTISVFKTVSDESVQAIHACQIRRGKLPTKIKSGSLCSELSSFLSKFLACSQTLYFLFTDVELAHENINWGGFIDFKRQGGGVGETKTSVHGPFWGNCPPTPPLRQHFALSEKKVLMLA